MYSDEIELERKQKESLEINLHPVTAGKRTLVYLGDLFISFILAVLFMNVMVMPIISLIVPTKNNESIQAEKNMDDVLYEHKLLFYKTPVGQPVGEAKQYDFSDCLSYTYKRFLAYYVFENNVSINPDFPEYARHNENEVFWHYYKDIRNDEITYYEIFDIQNQRFNYFEKSGDIYVLKPEIKNELIIFYKPGEELGSTGKKYYENISEMFSSIYGVMFQDIYQKDLTIVSSDSGQIISFRENKDIVDKNTNRFYMVIAISGLISYLLAFICVHLIYPLINKEGRTPTMSIMHIDRLGYRNLMSLSKGEVAILSTYSLLFDLPYIMFLSLSYTTIIYSFSVPILPILTLIGLLAVIISSFVILFGSFNRSISDMLAQAVLVPSIEVDQIIKTKEALMELNKTKKDSKNE